MAHHHVSVAIRIGGSLLASLTDAFLAAIDSDGARIDWAGTPVDRRDLSSGEALLLVAREVAWGQFERIELFCVEHRLPFARWAGGAPSAFGPERIVFDGEDVRTYPVTDDDDLMVSASDIRVLGSYEAILRKIERAEFEVPPFRLVKATA